MGRSSTVPGPNANEIPLGPKKPSGSGSGSGSGLLRKDPPKVKFSAPIPWDPDNPEMPKLVREGKCLPPLNALGFVNPFSVWVSVSQNPEFRKRFPVFIVYSNPH